MRAADTVSSRRGRGAHGGRRAPSNATPGCRSSSERQTSASDVGERGGGDEAHGERARQVVVLATALVPEVKRVLLLPLVGVAEQDHLTQEGVHDHVLVVDLVKRSERQEEGERGKEGIEKTKTQ